MASSTTAAGFFHRKGTEDVWSPAKFGVGSHRFFRPAPLSRKQNFGSSSIRLSRQQNFGSSSIRLNSSNDNSSSAVAAAVLADDVSPPLQPPRSPWLMLPPSFDNKTDEMVFSFYDTSKNTVVNINNKRPPFLKRVLRPTLFLPAMQYVGSSHGWLALDYYSDRDEQFLYNPLTAGYIDLPPTHALPVNKKIYPDDSVPITKLILSCSPDDDDCIAMISYDYDGRLAFCRLSDGKDGSSTEWTPIGKPFLQIDDNTFYRNYEDFVYSAKRKLFFCVTEFGELEAWDLRDPHSPPKIAKTKVWVQN